MPRIRSIKPDMRRSLTVCAWPYVVRWTFVGLPGYLDDYGRGIDDTRLVKAELYPLDDDMTAKKIDGHLRTIAETGPLCRYEIDGRRYMHITSWGEHQKPAHPTPSRIPPCPIHDKLANDSRNDAARTGDKLGNDSRNPPENFSASRAPAEQGAGNREQGEEQGAGSALDARRREQALAAIIDDWITTSPKRPPERVISQLADEIGKLLREGIDPEDVRAGVAAWTGKRLHATNLPALVYDVMARPPTNGTATNKAAGWLTVDQPPDTTPALEGRPA